MAPEPVASGRAGPPERVAGKPGTQSPVRHRRRRQKKDLLMLLTEDDLIAIRDTLVPTLALLDEKLDDLKRRVKNIEEE